MSHAPHRHDRAAYTMLDRVASPVFVLEMDADDVPRYVAFNAHARVISGRPLSDYLGRTALQVYPDGLGRGIYARHLEAARTMRPLSYEMELLLGGRNRTIRTTLMPERMTDGRVGRLVGTGVDITLERNHAEAQVSFDTMTTEMEQFVALAAHDLRAPMRNMALLVEMLKEDFVDHGDGKRELIGMMDDVAAKSMTLIADVLDHAHAHATTTVQTASTVNFANICRDICDVLDPRGLHVFTYTAARVHTDRTALQIGLRNIIANALKFGGREQLRIDITVQRGSDKTLNVMICNDGPGIPEKALDFIRGGPFRTDSGYGLLGVRRMVQARGGTMTAENVADAGGTVVRFSLPGEWIGATNSFGEIPGEPDARNPGPGRRAGGMR